MDRLTPRSYGDAMTVLLRLALLSSVLASSLALSGCLVRSDRGYYQGNGGGYRGHPHGGPPGQRGGNGHGNGHGNGRGRD